MLATVSVGSVNQTVPLPWAGVRGIVLLAPSKESLEGKREWEGDRFIRRETETICTYTATFFAENITDLNF